MAWRNRFRQYKAFQKEISKELMFIAWHPTRSLGWQKSEDEKEEIELFLIVKVDEK